MPQFADIYRGRRVLLTGHTGFKGSWLALWLDTLGARVTGIALDPDTEPNHWTLTAPRVEDVRQDIRDAAGLAAVVERQDPEIIFHLAAQPLVRRSYREPLETWSTNVMGTANLLDACRRLPSLKAVVIVTTDKCYDNQEWERGYREDDRLGGHDPYSASKAATELLAASYRKAFFEPAGRVLLTTARAGNVIGGGDWSQDRLIPDLVRAVVAGRALEIRSPQATRPWQHVLESASGYLMLGQALLEGRKDRARAWNFGPDQEGNRPVREVLERLRAEWPALTWEVGAAPQLHEATLLYLDSSLARNALGWKPVWGLDRALSATAAWYRSWQDGGRVVSREQLATYISDARAAGLAWSGG
jgi:CDP-glucose 4,6-dehydratase